MPPPQHNRQHATGPSLASKSGKRKKQARKSVTAKRDDGASGSFPSQQRVDRIILPSKKIDAVANPPVQQKGDSLRTPEKKRPSTNGSNTTPKLKKKNSRSTNWLQQRALCRKCPLILFTCQPMMKFMNLRTKCWTSRLAPPRTTLRLTVRSPLQQKTPPLLRTCYQILTASLRLASCLI